ncbi:PrgH/EprH family type III secretion apparatus protein [Pseudomonas sp. 14P_8.1_Bac3]|uniref:PrgH/EprH family type III secretion apparatus protein n=1 Tax=Pseudomonas sp. 14P_8.1_Bac3 TaxID=2971621 RepID=UPI0021C90C0C|nr:PrgH/EprH family type III secretion apparatus protein [Pseudomonas sp. 14P_8.1_Bac3]MCU1761464.1 PrgH/EprH family type III secretion apparatus protein [Pseudomonas sp. 14P_8.1_Bac3]
MTDLSAPPQQPCVLRIFNGPLQGCEFPLGAPRTLFIVGPLDLLGRDATAITFPEDAIFVPLEHDACNFEVLLDGQGGATLRLLNEQTQTRCCDFQRLTQIGGLQIALRSEDQSWAPELLGQQDLPLADKTPRHRPQPAAIQWAGAGLILVVLAISAGFWSVPAPTAETDVRALIAGASAEFTVVQGRDQTVYVFVASERDAGWSRQVLMRNNGVAAKVVVTDQERRRLEQLLVDLDPQLAWHSLDLQDPAMPRLLLSAQRNLLTPQEQTQLLDVLLKAAPYAREVDVQVQDDNLLADLAEQGLRRLALTFNRVGHDNSVTFAIEGDLQDAELAAARRYVDGFHRQWGNRYVHFAVELKDDGLKGKSFQTGPQGYIKMTSSSWHFPKQIQR